MGLIFQSMLDKIFHGDVRMRCGEMVKLLRVELVEGCITVIGGVYNNLLLCGVDNHFDVVNDAVLFGGEMLLVGDNGFLKLFVA